MNNNNGFSFSELLVVLAITSVIASFTYPSLVSTLAAAQTKGIAESVVKSLELCKSQAMNYESFAHCEFSRDADGNWVAQLSVDTDNSRDLTSADRVFHRVSLGESINQALYNNQDSGAVSFLYSFDDKGVPRSQPQSVPVFCSRHHELKPSKYRVVVPNVGSIKAEELGDAGCA